MKFFIHPVNIPRKLASRFQKPVIDSTKAWDNFKGTKEVHDSLIPVQKYLCSYCEIELDRGDGELGYHIEHIEPKSSNSSFTFKFSNLLISCFNSGHEISPSVYDSAPISCGHAKKDAFDSLLFIKPTDLECEDYFYYELDGRIVPNPSLDNSHKFAQAVYTINLLNLNCRRLKRERKDIISEGLDIAYMLSGSPDALSDFASLELEEINNKNFAFFTTRRQYFQDFIN